MIIDSFKIKGCHITVLYECSCDDIDFIIKTLTHIDCPEEYIEKALDNLERCDLNSGLTYTNIKLKSSVIVINKTSSFEQLINTISHEYYHLIQHLSIILNIEDEEELAYLNGDLNMRSYKIVRNLEKVGSE